MDANVGKHELDSIYVEILDTLLTRIQEQFGEKLVSFYYYGSLARGDMHKASDIDVLAIIDSDDEAELRKLMDSFKKEVESLYFGAELEPVFISKATAERANWVAILKTNGVLYSGKDFYQDKVIETDPYKFLNALYKRYFLSNEDSAYTRSKRAIREYTVGITLNSEAVIKDTRYLSKSFFRIAVALCIKRTGNTELFTIDPNKAEKLIAEYLPEFVSTSNIAGKHRKGEYENTDPEILHKLSQDTLKIMNELEEVMDFSN